jgi:hypothetical protein
VIGGWRKLHNEELHNMYSSSDSIRIIRMFPKLVYVFRRNVVAMVLELY